MMLMMTTTPTMIRQGIMCSNWYLDFKLVLVVNSWLLYMFFCVYDLCMCGEWLMWEWGERNLFHFFFLSFLSFVNKFLLLKKSCVFVWLEIALLIPRYKYAPTNKNYIQYFYLVHTHTRTHTSDRWLSLKDVKYFKDAIKKIWKTVLSHERYKTNIGWKKRFPLRGNIMETTW